MTKERHGLACHRVGQRSRFPYMKDSLGLIPRLVIKDSELDRERTVLEDWGAATGKRKWGVHFQYP